MSSINGPPGPFMCHKWSSQNIMVRVDKKAFSGSSGLRLSLHGHLPQTCQASIKQLDGLGQCELGVSLKETHLEMHNH